MNDLSKFFSLNKLPYNNGEIIPKDWVKIKNRRLFTCGFF